MLEREGKPQGLHLARIHLQREIFFSFAVPRLNFFTRGASPRGSRSEDEPKFDTVFDGHVYFIA